MATAHCLFYCQTDRQLKSRAIYFDGYLPTSKRLVRMERMMKNTTKLNMAYAAWPQGYVVRCPRLQGISDVHLFKSGRLEGKHYLDPTFLVPAVVDAIRQRSKYEGIVHVVPGEADGYCAGYVARHGGVILTSDSDLLAHDIANGKVVFLRDIYMDADSTLLAATFTPRNIYRRLGLPNSTKSCRFAYELKLSHNATLPKLLQACVKPIVDEIGFGEFCRQYACHEGLPLPTMACGHVVSLTGMDPRISELMIQFGGMQHGFDGHCREYKIFLPILMEDPSKGSAWEQSTPVRQLAYTIAGWALLASSTKSVQEYRRVQSLGQRGRTVNLLSKETATSCISELCDIIAQVKASAAGKLSWYWIILCSILNIRECREHEKYSHVLGMLCEGTDKVPHQSCSTSWDLIHFVAQLQAGLYSLRTLHQVLNTLSGDLMDALPADLRKLRQCLSYLPELNEYPDTVMTIRFLDTVRYHDICQLLKDFVYIREPVSDPPEQIDQERRTKNVMEKQKKKSKNGYKRKSKSKGPVTTKTHIADNMFSLLPEILL